MLLDALRFETILKGQECRLTMTEAEFRALYPAISAWIHKTLSAHAAAARPVESAGFKRLPLYFKPATLASAKFVVVKKVPVPPLSAMGLTQFAEFERGDFAGITYLDTYFVRADRSRDEPLHFHELVHVVQWRHLGPEQFLKRYADGLERFGYRRSPLERIAYDLEEQFGKKAQPFDAEAECVKRVGRMAESGS